MNLKLAGAFAFALAVLGAAQMSPSAAQTQAPVVMSGLSPAGQKVWDKCADATTRQMRRQMAESNGSMEQETEAARSQIEKYAALDKSKLQMIIDIAKDGAASGEVGADVALCYINARLAQLNPPAPPKSPVAASSTVPKGIITIPGLSPNAQALWVKCADVTTRVIKLEAATWEGSSVKQLVVDRRAPIEAIAVADTASILANYESTLQSASAGLPLDLSLLHKEFLSCYFDARLAQLGSVTAPQTGGASSVVGAQSNADVDGVWKGDTSSNEVTMELRSDGLYVVAVTNNSGQSEPLVFNSAGPGEYRYTFPGGQQSVVKMQGPGVLRITNPDGWTDVFRLVRRN